MKGLTTSEMLWVLDNVKECVQRREDRKCTHECKKCQCFIEYTSLLQAIDSIMNLVYRAGENGRRK